MAGHSRWSNIKHRKGAADAVKAAVIAKMAKFIAVAVQVGGGQNPDDNPRLRLAIAKGRAVQMSNEAIERAIKKGGGEGLGGRVPEPVSYEGYAPGGIAIVVDALTDNRNRTAPEIRRIFERAGSQLGAPGCVAWQFRERSVFHLDGIGEERAMEILLEAECDASDIRPVDDGSVVFADPALFARLQQVFAAAGATVADADIRRVPENRVAVDRAHAEALLSLLDILEEHDDVQNVAHNAE